MIARPVKRERHLLSKTTIASFRNLARRGTDAELEAFLYRVTREYIASVRNTDYIDEENYINVKDVNYDVICPCCGVKLELEFDLKDLTEGI